LGFFGDVLNGILDGDGSESFGQRIRRDNPALMEFYRKTYFDFGLPPARNIKEGSVVPVRVSLGFGNQMFGFEIRGNILTPLNFLSSGWGSPFHTIARDFPLTKGRVWAYDIRRLNESILTGEAVFPGDEAYRRSEEYLKILRIIGSASTPPLSRVPAIELGFGRIWEQFGIPDNISVSLDSVYPFSDNHLKNVINLILHNYNRNPAPPVAADYTWNPQDGTLKLVMRDTSVPTAPPEPEVNQSADDFPYDFYRGLGLIDDEDMVAVPSFIGPIRTHMTENFAKEYLLSYKPDA
jgi:hypothetical protein